MTMIPNAVLCVFFTLLPSHSFGMQVENQIPKLNVVGARGLAVFEDFESHSFQIGNSDFPVDNGRTPKQNQKQQLEEAKELVIPDSPELRRACAAIATDSGPTNAAWVSYMVDADVVRERLADIKTIYNEMELELQQYVAPLIAGCPLNRNRIRNRKLEEEMIVVHADFQSFDEKENDACNSIFFPVDPTLHNDECSSTNIPMVVYHGENHDVAEFPTRIKNAIDQHSWDVAGVKLVKVNDVTVTGSGEKTLEAVPEALPDTVPETSTVPEIPTVTESIAEKQEQKPNKPTLTESKTEKVDARQNNPTMTISKTQKLESGQSNFTVFGNGTAKSKSKPKVLIIVAAILAPVLAFLAVVLCMCLRNGSSEDKEVESDIETQPDSDEDGSDFGVPYKKAEPFYIIDDEGIEINHYAKKSKSMLEERSILSTIDSALCCGDLSHSIME